MKLCVSLKIGVGIMAVLPTFGCGQVPEADVATKAVAEAVSSPPPTCDCSHPGQLSSSCQTCQDITIPIPSDVVVQSLGVGGGDSVSIRTGAKILGIPPSFASLSQTASPGQGVTLASGATVGNITASGPVSLAALGMVGGTVRSGSTVSVDPLAVVTGGITTNVASMGDSFGWPVSFPSTNSGDVLAVPGPSLQLAPGAYGTVHVPVVSNITLSVGTYYMQKLHVDPTSTVWLDTTQGPIFVYVQSSLVLQGGVAHLAGDLANDLFAYLGTQPVNVQNAFAGTLVAPHASVLLSTTLPLVGALFGSSVTLGLGTTVIFTPFEAWQGLVNDNTDQAGLAPPPVLVLGGLTPPPALGGTGAAAPAAAHNFISWASGSAVSQAGQAQAAIAAAQGNADIANALVAEMNLSDPSQLDRNLVVMSILGELQSSNGEAFFTSVVNTPLPVQAPPQSQDELLGVSTGPAILQAKAIDGLAFMGTPTAKAQVLNQVANSPSPHVRAEGILAYINDNGAQGRADVLNVIRPEDEIVLDWYPHVSETDSIPIDTKLQTYLSKHPEAVIPAPADATIQ
jgi:hypothetical protein